MKNILDIKKAYQIMKKELRSFFHSPVGYVFICFFLIVFGVLFFFRFFLVNQLEMRVFFQILPFVLAFAVPGITMFLFADEFNIGSYEIINTTPVKPLELILGKFFAASLFMITALILTLVYPITLSFLGDLDWGPVIGGYIGSFLLVFMLSAIGVFASSLTKSNFLALIIGWAISSLLCLVLYNFVVPFMPPVLARIFEYLSANYHFVSIAVGTLDLTAIIYFLSITFIALYATKLSLELRK